METTYFAALTLMKKENILDKFANRTEKVVTETSGIGWGFHDYLGEIYTEFYADFADDVNE